MRLGFVSLIITLISAVTAAFGDWTFHDGATRSNAIGAEDYPSARAYTAHCQFHDRDLFVMFGGYGVGWLSDQRQVHGYLSDLWFHNTTTLLWSRSPNPQNPFYVNFDGLYHAEGYHESNWPSSRYDAKLFCLEKEDKVILLGGLNEGEAGRSNRPYSDVWECSLTLHQWKRIYKEDIEAGIIYNLRDYSAAYFEPDQYLIVVGGNWNESNGNNASFVSSRDVWNLGLNSIEWSIVEQEARDEDPPVVINAASVLIPPSKIYSFGGRSICINFFANI